MKGCDTHPPEVGGFDRRMNDFWAQEGRCSGPRCSKKRKNAEVAVPEQVPRQLHNSRSANGDF